MAESSNNALRVRLVTPDRILVDQTVDAVEVPSQTGSFEVLYGAAPLLAVLGAGEVRLHGGEGEGQRYHVARGFVEVLPERVTILAETALKPEEIDTGAAQQMLDRGHKLWNEAGEDAGKYAHAEEVIEEAESRLASTKSRAR
jgi:F-type H+-transporting ATPase subunit epsilon